MSNLAIVALGGALGAVARYEISARVQQRWGGGPGAFPVGTLVVNALGCLVLGALMAWVAERAQFAPRTRLFVGIGLLGSFTTFSTFGFETIELARHGKLGGALLNVALNVLVGCAFVALGRFAVVRALD